MDEQPRSVLFIGITQMGKSSLLKAILKYGSCHTLAETVSIGDGNVSQTQTVTSYQCRINIHEHFLQDNDGRRVKPDVDTDGDDYTNVSVKTTDRVSLNMVDTPGISDSQGLEASLPASGGSQTSKFSTNVIDELHKMRVLLQLTKLNNLHAVVFVVKYAQSYSASFERVWTNYLQLFEVSSINPTYSVVHTGVSAHDVLSGAAGRRALDFHERFGREVTHHYIENYPSRRDPVAIYHSAQGIANLLRSFSKSESVRIGDLRYPKTEAINQAEYELNLAFDRVAQILVADIGEHEAGVIDNTRQGDDCETKKQLSQIRIDELTYQLERLDTDTLMQVGDSIHKYRERTMFNRRPSVQFQVTCSYPIADVVKESCSHGVWQSEDLQNNTYTVELRASRYQDISGTIAIRCRKRDVKAREIGVLKSKIADELSNKLKHEEQSELRSNAAALARSKRDTAKSRLGNLTEQRHRFLKATTSIPVRQNMAVLAHLAAGKILCTAKAYGLTFEFDASRLLMHSATYASETNKLDQEAARQTRLSELRRNIDHGIQEQIRQHRSLMAALQMLRQKTETRLEKLQNTNRETATLIGNIRLEAPTPMKGTDLIWTKSSQRVVKACTMVQDFIGAQISDCLSTIEQMTISEERASLLIEEAEALRLGWIRSIADSQRALRAVRSTRELIGKPRLNIGQLAVLNKASADGAESKYMALFDETEALLRADETDL